LWVWVFYVVISSDNADYFALCLFFRSFFLRLCVAIFLSLRFLPQGIKTPIVLIKRRKPFFYSLMFIYYYLTNNKCRTVNAREYRAGFASGAVDRR
jgi:hypothetical protein